MGKYYIAEILGIKEVRLRVGDKVHTLWKKSLKSLLKIDQHVAKTSYRSIFAGVLCHILCQTAQNVGSAKLSAS